MSTFQEDQTVQQVELLIGESFDSVDARLYVYRDNGSGRVEGTYLKRYEKRVELEDLRRDLGPGMYVLMQNRGPGGRPVTRRVFVPADPASSIVEANAPAQPGGSRLNELKEILEMKMISDQLRPREPDPMKIITTVLELVRGTQPRDPLEAFLQGAKWNGADAGGEDLQSLLTAAGARLLERRVPGGAGNGEGSGEPLVSTGAIDPTQFQLGFAKKLIGAFNERMARTDQLLTELAARVNGGSPVTVSLLEIFQALLVGSYESGEHVAVVLRIMDKSSGGALRRELESYQLEELLTHMKNGLEQSGHAERFDSFRGGLEIFLEAKGR